KAAAGSFCLREIAGKVRLDDVLQRGFPGGVCLRRGKGQRRGKAKKQNQGQKKYETASAPYLPGNRTVGQNAKESFFQFFCRSSQARSKRRKSVFPGEIQQRMSVGGVFLRRQQVENQTVAGRFPFLPHV